MFKNEFTKKKNPLNLINRPLVGDGGFEPPKHNATDLQSAPFDRSGIYPLEVMCGECIRIPVP